MGATILFSAMSEQPNLIQLMVDGNKMKIKGQYFSINGVWYAGKYMPTQKCRYTACMTSNWEVLSDASVWVFVSKFAHRHTENIDLETLFAKTRKKNTGSERRKHNCNLSQYILGSLQAADVVSVVSNCIKRDHRLTCFHIKVNTPAMHKIPKISWTENFVICVSLTCSFSPCNFSNFRSTSLS